MIFRVNIRISTQWLMLRKINCFLHRSMQASLRTPTTQTFSMPIWIKWRLLAKQLFQTFKVEIKWWRMPNMKLEIKTTGWLVWRIRICALAGKLKRVLVWLKLLVGKKTSIVSYKPPECRSSPLVQSLLSFYLLFSDFCYYCIQSNINYDSLAKNLF